MMERVSTPEAPAPTGHYEQAWEHGGLVFEPRRVFRRPFGVGYAAKGIWSMAA
jgi:hypothetical protein